MEKQTFSSPQATLFIFYSISILLFEEQIALERLSCLFDLS